jgi:hypothetical protein
MLLKIQGVAKMSAIWAKPNSRDLGLSALGPGRGPAVVPVLGQPIDSEQDSGQTVHVNFTAI